MKKGFSLMEVIIAVAVITTALISSISLLVFSISGIRIGSSKTIAAGLIQEGLEIVRNTRDNNWLAYKRKPSDWRDGLEADIYEVQYNELSLRRYYEPGNYLKIDGNGYYNYSSGIATPFKRKIIIEHIGNNQIKVISEVDWQEKGKNYNIKAENLLYNWLEEE